MAWHGNAYHVILTGGKDLTALHCGGSEMVSEANHDRVIHGIAPQRPPCHPDRREGSRWIALWQQRDGEQSEP
jgi:hypothetical protein